MRTQDFRRRQLDELPRDDSARQAVSSMARLDKVAASHSGSGFPDSSVVGSVGWHREAGVIVREMGGTSQLTVYTGSDDGDTLGSHTFS